MDHPRLNEGNQWREMAVDLFLSFFVTTTVLYIAEFAWEGSVSRFLPPVFFLALTILSGFLAMLVDYRGDRNSRLRLTGISLVFGALALFVVSDLSFAGRVGLVVGFLAISTVVVFPKLASFRDVDD